MSENMIKSSIRAEVRARLEEIGEPERLRRATLLPPKMREVSAFGARPGSVMGYLAYGTELDVSPVFWLAWSYLHGVCVPRTDWEAKRITPVKYTPGCAIERGSHGVPEVVGGEPVPDESVVIVLVPGVAFDRDGNRLGRGGGFYDRLLERLAECGSARPVFVGVCFAEQVIEDIPVEQHDVRMDSVIAV